MNYWPIPRKWEGETVVIIGGGPSLDLAQIHRVGRAKLYNKCKVLVINDAMYVAWWADWLHGCDRKWWDWHAQQVNKFQGVKTTLDETLPPQWRVNVLHNTGKTGFDPEPTNCRTGANGAYQAMHCMIHAGVKKIILLGVDMKETDRNNTHWFGQHPNKAHVNYDRVMMPHFETLLPTLKARKIKVYNCSPDTALKTFKRVPLDEAIRI